MFDIQYPAPAERVVLAALMTPSVDSKLFDEDIQEMIMLCRTAGADVKDVIIQKLGKPKAATYMGKGKLIEIEHFMKENECAALILDAELSPGQIRNIEKVISAKVIDRSQLILDIFAQHARTNEARIQVELAQLRTLYPRLTGAWTHFSKQVGGIGTRGPGEKQLEVDRRLVQKKISDLKKRLGKIERSRDIQSKKRRGSIRLALVGYTNVGKSSLLNALSGSKVLVENKLFATLDTATRRTFIQGIGDVVISDTVGFLRKLPHHLVASFRSTLEVVRDADILMIVLDASSSFYKQQLDIVISVLDDLGVKKDYQCIIFNKSDLCKNDDNHENRALELGFSDNILVSALNNLDMERLKGMLCDMVTSLRNKKDMDDIIEKQSKSVNC